MKSKNRSKLFYAVGGVSILVLAVYFFANYSKQPTTTVSDATETANQSEPLNTATKTEEQKADEPTPTPGAAKTVTQAPSEEAHYSNESDIDGGDVQVVAVDYDGKNFTPSLTNIKVGDIVFFKNEGSKSFWPASNPHPGHSLYPAFDAKRAYAAGETFQFKFTKAGKWGYHDHYNPSATGTINVTQ